MNRRPTKKLVLGLLAISISMASFAHSDDEAPATTDAASKWITSIASLGANTFVAGTADGLLLREAAVCSFKGSSPSELTELYRHPAAVWCVDTTQTAASRASITRATW